MRSRLAARILTLPILAALLALGLIACGEDSEDKEALDVAALETCLDEDPETDLEVDTGGFEDAAERPTDQWELTPTEAQPFPVPSFVLVFEDEATASAAVANIGKTDLIDVGESGTVRWVIVNTDDGYSDQLDSTISDCVDQAG